MASDDQRLHGFDPLSELDVREDELRESLLSEFLARDCVVLPPSRDSFDGCGVYAIYYYGDHPRYAPVSNERGSPVVPIYVGKAVPSGARKGGAHLAPAAEPKLAQRLAEHRTSIEQAENLDLADFRCRYLPLGSVWIRFTEQLLISAYSPWWNSYIEGFGLHDVGEGRAGSEMSVWDALHPGRPWVGERDLTPPDAPDGVWEDIVSPQMDRAKQDRRYKDLATIERLPGPQTHAPTVEEASLHQFTRE